MHIRSPSHTSKLEMASISQDFFTSLDASNPRNNALENEARNSSDLHETRIKVAYKAS